MKKKIMAFYDALLYLIICGPMIVTAIILIFMLITRGTSEWIYKNWYLVLIFSITFMFPIGGILMLRYFVFNNDTVHFHYFPFTTSWDKAANNIDIRWNQNILISEIENIEIVKITDEERKTKVYYKHWFNKYLLINLKNGDSKYVYVGNYSNNQIKKIIKLMMKKVNKN